ncbi:MAG: DNA-binding response regulator, partial [Clostridiales bacterium]|nr:DNA-binding response regulator [Clostridiales bacterium]
LKECAITLDISYGTVKFHAANIYRKLGIGGRSELLSVFKDL